MFRSTMVPVYGTTNNQIFTDAQLLTLVGEGEHWALTEIYARYARLVFSVALDTLKDPASAEEIVQLVFTKVWRYARHYKLERGKFSAWVSTIARHQCIDEIRHRRINPITFSDDLEAFDNSKARGNTNPTRVEQDILEQARIREALQQIPTNERVVIELAYWGGMSHQEIALHCRAPLGTVKTRIRLGMRRLKQLLQEPA